MADFEEAVAVVLQHEDPGLTGAVTHDDGGTTRWGISAKANSSVDVARLSLDGAKAIYRTSYWGPLGGGAIQDQRVATKVLDMGVNMGVTTALKLLQAAVGVERDGIIGPQTIEATNAADPEMVLARLRTTSQQRYVAIAASDPQKYERYLAGWLRRAQH